MTIRIRHQEHTYTYQHPMGWSGGDEDSRKKLNEALPAGEYPAEAAEESAVKHALAGILAGGEVIREEAGHHHRGGGEAADEDGVLSTAADGNPDRILGTLPDSPSGDRDRILAPEPPQPSGDPDRILESGSEEL